jgi:hypothetical protein
MSIRNSQDVSLAVAQTTGKPRDSQDLTLAVAQTAGALRDSQDVLLVLGRQLVNGTVADSQASQALAATGYLLGVSTAQASQTLAASGTQTIKARDSQDLTLAVAQTVGKPRDSQDLTLAITQSAGAIRESQDVLLVLTPPFVGCATNQASQSLAATAVETIPKPDKPSIQFHPLVKPLDFYTAPPKQPGKPSASFTTLLTEAGAQRAFSMPLGARNQPIAGKVFSFTMGGMIVPGTVGGTLTITPLYGATADGVNLGQSISQAYPASTTPLPWRLKGEIIFQAVDLTPGASLVVCTGSFALDGLAIVFGSGNPIQVDAGAVSAAASGALNFAVTFAPSVMNVSPPVISAKYAFLR